MLVLGPFGFPISRLSLAVPLRLRISLDRVAAQLSLVHRRSIPTTVPGVRIAEHVPFLARQAKHYSLIRSLYHGNPSHAPAEHQMLTGWMGSREGTARAVIENPSLGSIVAWLAGPRRHGMPAYVAVPWSFHHAY